MKKSTVIFTVVLLAALLAIVVKAWAVDIAGQTIRYRQGTTLIFDPTVSLVDEDAAWSITAAKLSTLASLSASPTLRKNFATTNTPANLTNIIQSIDGALSLSNDWVGSFTGNGVGLSNVVAAYVDGTLTNSTTGNAATATRATYASDISTNALPFAGITNFPVFTYNLTVVTNGANTATLHITNGLIQSITAP